jgi:hypothetical protein
LNRIPAGEWQHSLEHGAVTDVDVPVVGTADFQARGHEVPAQDLRERAAGIPLDAR